MIKASHAALEVNLYSAVRVKINAKVNDKITELEFRKFLGMQINTLKKIACKDFTPKGRVASKPAASQFLFAEIPVGELNKK